MPNQYAIGVDYGTNSVRALIVDVSNGKEIGTSVYNYPSGKDGILLDSKDPNLARQNPADYIKGFVASVKGAIRDASNLKSFDVANVVGIGVGTTGSTPIPVDREGSPLAMQPKFAKNLAAHAWLWKDHTAFAEADEITHKAAKHKDGYLHKCGGTYSSEWYWSKILHCKRTAPAVFKAAYAWVELADFIPAYVTDNTNPDTLARNICVAGHKAMYHSQWGGLPSEAFLKSLDPALAPLRKRFATPCRAANEPAGKLSKTIARKVGLPEEIPVAAGALDAHMGAVGAGIKPGRLVKIIGTSTCDMMIAPMDKPMKDIPGLCGIVPGSIVPNMYGLEAGQSAVGDIFNWFVQHLVPEQYTRKGDAHTNLTKEAKKLKPGESGLLALDWNNGNRTILVDPLLSGMVVGQTLHTTAPEIYRALIEATAFGALTIIKRFEEYGVTVNEVVNCGGIAEKNPMVMQIYADVCNRPMKVSRSTLACALGAAIFGAVVGGAYKNTSTAQHKMTGVKPKVYRPRKQAAATYARLYMLYRDLHDAMGTTQHQGRLTHVMKELIAIRNQARKGT